MASFEEIRNTRIQKLGLLEKAGMNSYPSSSRIDYYISDVIKDFDEISKKDDIFLVGRVLSIRGQGGLVFFNFNDGTGQFQGLFKKDEMDEKVFDLFHDAVDIGDFIQINGKLFITKRGEKTVQVKDWKMLTKSLRPLPEKWHGLQDEDERFRKRYLDIISNPEVKEAIIKRAVFWKAMRGFLSDKNFMEVDTPILENTAGGAEAKPFITHYNAYDMDVYMRISPELWLKRLMVAGFPKVFEIGRAQDYIEIERSSTMFDLTKRVMIIGHNDPIGENDIVVEFDARQLTPEYYNQVIKQLPLILDQTEEIGTFEYGVFKITINSLRNKKDMRKPFFKNIF